jgi:LEA14-like dessication related protein
VADNKKNILLRVEPDFHQQVKLHVTMNNTTLQEYIVGLIKKDLETNKKEK